jgi:predicted 3-demethylubiquinone-9 3-methyltransferase (glyoxalase superfamily)
MPTPELVPCVWLDGQAEAAARLYTRAFPGAHADLVLHSPTGVDSPSGRPRGSVLLVELVAAGARLTLLDGGPQFRPSPNVSFFVVVATAGEADRAWSVLAEGGQPLMPIEAYPWSPRYGWIQDRFGVSWQVMTAPGPEARIVPCFMFAGTVHGRAEDAMKAWTAVFPASRVEAVERYGAGEGGPDGKVKHGRFVLAGQPFVAMDSHVAHDRTFDEGVSVQVMCEDQAAVDRYWAALSAGGEPGPCGWLKDRFGVSWQVVPTAMRRWFSDENPAGRDRCFQAMLQMGKLDVGALERAWAGR